MTTIPGSCSNPDAFCPTLNELDPTDPLQKEHLAGASEIMKLGPSSWDPFLSPDSFWGHDATRSALSLEEETQWELANAHDFEPPFKMDGRNYVDPEPEEITHSALFHQILNE